MDIDSILSIIKNHLVSEWQQLPIPVDNERVYKMIEDALISAKAELEVQLSKDS